LSPLQRKLLSSILKHARPPVSTAFAVGLARLACAVKARVAPGELLTIARDEQATLVDILRRVLEQLQQQQQMPGGAAVGRTSAASAPPSLAASAPADLAAEFRRLVAELDR
jgi:hypothetical protein